MTEVKAGTKKAAQMIEELHSTGKGRDIMDAYGRPSAEKVTE